jgi:hypothetical protein
LLVKIRKSYLFAVHDVFVIMSVIHALAIVSPKL